MRISIVTICFNSLASIEETFKSIQCQSYENIEYIVIDGNSSDGTVGIIKAYSTIITKWVSEKDQGLYDALNKGILMATGDVIGFLHSDDVFFNSDTISNISEAFNSKKFDGVYGDLMYVKRDNVYKTIRYWKSQSFTPSLLKKGWMPAHPTLFLKKEVYEKHGLFDLTYEISADYEFMLRIFKNFELKFGYLPVILTKMRIGGASNRSLKNIIKKTKEDYRAIKSHDIGNILTLLFKNITKIKQFF